MRYLIDPEHRVAPVARSIHRSGCRSRVLRQELSVRNIAWAQVRNCPHEVSLGSVPSVIYREDDLGLHGNFIDASYRAIKGEPQWARRLGKVHTSARRVLLSRDTTRCELDSCNSSDALLMNIFCHPSTAQTDEVRALLALDSNTPAVFGFRPGIALKSNRRDTTEIDLKLGSLFIEAKLTEADFRMAPLRLVERYRDFESIFDRHLLDMEGGTVRSYQLIRGILAVAAEDEGRFCVLCDARRSDLIDAWHRVMTAVMPYELRCRLQLLTWQELAAPLAADVQVFLHDKFGIVAAGIGSGSR